MADDAVGLGGEAVHYRIASTTDADARDTDLVVGSKGAAGRAGAQAHANPKGRRLLQKRATRFSGHRVSPVSVVEQMDFSGTGGPSYSPRFFIKISLRAGTRF